MPSITSEELADLALDVIEELAGERYATNFVRWREVEDLDVPLVILIGGATGVGKSTIATQLAARLGIVRVVATDAIREVMRAMLSPELMPTLHVSSFQADSALREPPTRSADALVARVPRADGGGLGRHQRPDRARRRRGDQHRDRGRPRGAGILRPGLARGPHPRGTRSWWVSTTRSATAPTSPPERTRSAVPPATRYVEGFDDIRRLQRYIKSQALAHGVPVIPNYSFDQSIAAVIDLVMEQATTAPRGRSSAANDGRTPRGKDRRHEAVPGHREHRGDPRDQPLGRARRRDHEPLAGGEGGGRPRRVWKEILDEVEGDVSLEMTGPRPMAMYRAGHRAGRRWAPNAVVKVPMTPDGLDAGKAAHRRGASGST